MNMKFGRTWLMLALALVMILSVTGGTIAWFTDSVESTGNVIQAGNLDIKLYVDGTEVTEENNLPLFGSDLLWEPGYVAYKKVKIENAGNLAFNYSFGINPSSIISNGTGNLADVIEVYAFNEVPTRELVNAATPVGTLTTIGAGDNNVFTGTLLPATDKRSDNVNENETITASSEEKYIVLKMQESAGNEYQNSSLSNLSIKLVATQYAYEEDSFDHTYDKDADDSSAPSDLPKAQVNKIDTTITEIGGKQHVLNTAYEFIATETAEEGAISPYAHYHADFVVTVDKNLPANTITLAGQYDNYNKDWLVIPIDQEVTASTPYRLLDSVQVDVEEDKKLYIDYAALCSLVKNFKCGVKAENAEAAKGVTMTVELRLYEVKNKEDTVTNTWNEETGKYYVIGEYPYTFE